MDADRSWGRSRFQQGSFTLVELLVVIAIVGLLAALLMPALRKAKDRANQVICTGNLRQIGVAALLYLDDNGGYFMHFAPPYRHFYRLAPYLNQHF